MNALKKALKKKLTKKELELVPRAFDLIGSIAIFSDFPEELEKKEKLIGETLIELHSNIKTVCKKVKDHSGVYRTRKLKIIAGKRSKETEYIENGVRMKLNVETCYFSPRLSNERQRIAQKVKEGEEVLVLFSGVCPYGLIIAKKSLAKSITCVEINPKAHKYALENVEINKMEDKINLYNKNALEFRTRKKYDRIIMPLPGNSEEFLGKVMGLVKKGSVVHIYLFCEKDKFVKEAKKKVLEHVDKKLKFLDVVLAGAASPAKVRVCVDFEVL